MLRFSIPRLTAERIARLHLACAADLTAIHHIGVRVTPTAVRFCSTNGRILASLLVPIDDLQGTPGDLLLDHEQIAAALKVTTKASGGRIALEIGPQEARITNGTASAIVRRVDGSFPVVDHVWTRPAGRRWIPTISSLDPGLVTIAQKISGSRQPLLFASPVDPALGLERLWATAAVQSDVAVGLGQLRTVVAAPAYWADHELAILIMPITRSDGERQIDLGAHALPAAVPTAVPAAAAA